MSGAGVNVNLAAGRFGPGQARSAIEAMLKDKFAEEKKNKIPSDIDSGSTSDEKNSAIKTPSKSPSKSRSLSDSTPKLSPSPKIKEGIRQTKDDHNLTTPSKGPNRRAELASGLSLRLPPREQLGIESALAFASRVPLSPKVDTRNTYGSPAKVLPRHSRGLDFARACTHLHHSTLAEQSSPDSSPTIAQKGMMIPPRKMSMNAMLVDAPNHPDWTTNRSDRGGVPSSLGSVSMLASDSSSSDDDDDDPMDPEDGEDTVITTPHVYKRLNPAASTPITASTGSATNWASMFSPIAGSSLMNFQRARLRNNRSRKSSSSASGRSSMASPAPTSPSGKTEGASYFMREPAMRKASSRRESISFATNDLHISSGNDSDTEATRPMPNTPGVVRRPVTRRGNLLPKTRAFGRIRAELLDESMPVDAEIKSEAEVLRQVRESDMQFETSLATTSHSSPTMAAVSGIGDGLEGIPEDGTMNLDSNGLNMGKGLFGAFGRHSSIANTTEFWTNFQKSTRTPPPPPFPSFPRESTSTASDDVSMESLSVSTPSTSVFPSNIITDGGMFPIETSRSSTPQPQQSHAAQPPTAADGLRKSNKRRRDDDFDVMSLKRRAVSPGVSLQNSPILSQSPNQRSDLWGQPRINRETSTTSNNCTNNNDWSSSTSSTVPQSTPVLGPKRVGLQGMNDMQGLTEKMSLE